MRYKQNSSAFNFLFVALCALLSGPASSEPAAVGTSQTESVISEPEIAKPATQVKRAQLVDAGKGGAYLLVREKLSRAWQSTGQALQELGLVVDDQDRWSGVYDILYPVQGISAVQSGKQKQSTMSRLGLTTGDAEKSHRHYQLKLEKEVAGKTRIIVRDHEGQWQNSEVTVHILTLLHDQLNMGAVVEVGHRL